MCGRFAVFSSVQDILAYQDFLEAVGDYEPRYNVAPGQNSLVVTSDGDGPRLRNMRWGLAPHWSRDAGMGARLINARGETAHEKPAFRESMRQRRCLVLASGFYEWQKPGRAPWFLRPAGRELFTFAGLWELWQGGEEPLYTFTILTTAPNDFMSRIHDRMPVILPREVESEWLLHGPRELLVPYAQPMEGWPVSRAVNSPANEGPRLIERVETQSEAF